METIRITTERTGNSVAQTVRDHPLPAALAAAGIAWLVTAAIKDRRSNCETVMAGGSHFGTERFDSGQGTHWRDEVSARASGAAERALHAASEVRDRARDAAERAASTASDLGHRVSDAAHRTREGAADLGHRTREQAAEFGHRIADTASHLAQQVRERQSLATEKMRHGAVQARETAEHTFYEHPITTGAAALALGIAAGLAVPSTRREREIMGRRRDDLLHEAREYGEELMERGKHVAHAAVDAGKDAARDALDDAKHAARDAGEEVKDAVKEEARRQHLTPGEMKKEAKERVGSTLSEGGNRG